MFRGICFIYGQWCISQCNKIILKLWSKTSAKKQVYVCVLQSRLRHNNEWMNVISTSIHSWVMLENFRIKYNTNSNHIDETKRNGNIKEMKRKQSYRNEIDVTMNRRLWRHVVYCTLFYYIMAWYLLGAVSSPFQFFAWPLFSLLLLPLLLLLLLSLLLWLWCAFCCHYYVCDWLFLSGFFPFDLCVFSRAHSAIFSCIT